MSAFVRRERPPSASGVRSDSRGPQQQQQHGGGGSGGSARSAFAPASAFDPHPPQPHYDYPVPPSQPRGSYGIGSSPQSSASGSGGGVKLPPAGNYAPPTNNEGVAELRSALAREIEYRRQLEGEVAQMRDGLARLTQAQQRVEAQLAATAERATERGEPDTSSTVLAPSKASHHHRPHKARHGHTGSVGSGGLISSPSSSPPSLAQQALLHLAPVLPLSTKVAEFEERFNEEKQETLARHTALSQQVSTLENSLESGMQLAEESLRASEERLASQVASVAPSVERQVGLAETRLREQARRAEHAQTEMAEAQAHTLRNLAATVETLQTALGSDRRAGGETAQSLAALQQQQADLRAQVSAFAPAFAAVEGHTRALKDLSALVALPAKLDQLASASEAQKQSLALLERDRGAAAAVAESRLSDLEQQCRSLRSAQAALESSAARGDRSLRQHMDESLRALPVPDPALPARVNNLFVQLDRLEGAVDSLAKQVAKKPSGSSKPQTPANNEQDENMRAIRAAIGTVDHKITESNALNTQLHERMNGIDAALAGSKRSQADVLSRAKAAAISAREAEAKLEGAAAALAAVETRLGKVEAEWRAREGRERERRRLDKEKEEQTQAQSPAPSAGASTPAAAAAAGAGSGAGGSGLGAAESDPPEPWKALLHEQLKRERGKAKVASKALELALQEQLQASSTVLASRVEVLESGARKRSAAAVAEEKRRAEELTASARAMEQHRADLDAHQSRLEALAQRVEEGRAAVDALAGTVAKEDAAAQAMVSQCEAQLRAMVGAAVARLDALESAAAASVASASATFSSSDGALLRAELDTLVGKSNQQWALVSACNKELMRLEEAVSSLQGQIAAASHSGSAPALDEKRVQELVAQQYAPLAQQLVDQRALIDQIAGDRDKKQLEIGTFAGQVSELRVRHDQLRHELDLQENKLAQQMAHTDYTNHNVSLLAAHVKLDLPKQKAVGSAGGSGAGPASGAVR